MISSYSYSIHKIGCFCAVNTMFSICKRHVYTTKVPFKVRQNGTFIYSKRHLYLLKVALFLTQSSTLLLMKSL